MKAVDKHINGLSAFLLEDASVRTSLVRLVTLSCILNWLNPNENSQSLKQQMEKSTLWAARIFLNESIINPALKRACQLFNR